MKNLFFIFILIILSNCSNSNPKSVLDSLTKSNLQLTDDIVYKYINTYKEIRSQGVSYLQNINDHGFDNKGEGFEKVEGIIKKNGFKDYFEFVRINAKIAWTYNLTAGELGMDKFGEMKDDGVKKIDEQLKDPLLPEAAKEELRKARQKIIDNWNKNKPWADAAINLTKSLTNQNDAQIIKKHHKELTAAFIGIKLPEPK